MAARRLLDDDSAMSGGLAEMYGRAAGWRSRAAMQASLAVAEVPAPDDERVRGFRPHLFDHWPLLDH